MNTQHPSGQRISVSKGVFHAAIFVFALIVYAVIYNYVWRFVSYPIELEWREGTFWLHALAQSNGVNIFKSDQIAYANACHGIFDHIIKGSLAHLFRSVEPQYILRIFVLIFPAISFVAIFAQNRKILPPIASAISALCLCNAMLVCLYDIGHWNATVGRSDPTVFSLLIAAYLCYTTKISTFHHNLLRHLSYLAIALVLSTNWRVYPIALTIPVIMEQCRDTLQFRELIRTYLLILIYTLGTCALFILVWFHADVSMYYRYFFGFFGTKSPWPAVPGTFQTVVHYIRTPAIAFLLLFSSLPVFLEGWRLIYGRSTWQKALAAFAFFLSLLTSILALKMNFLAGGYWYLCPQIILLIIYYSTRYRLGPGRSLAILLFSLCVLSQSDNLPLMKWYYRLLDETLPAARAYTQKLIVLDRAFGVYSEEAHLFKRSRPLPAVDMGDTAEAFAKANYVGPRFTAVFFEQKAKIITHEPVIVFIGPCASTAFKELAENEEYYLLLTSPTLAIGGNVYARKDHIEDIQRVLADQVFNAR